MPAVGPVTRAVPGGPPGRSGWRRAGCWEKTCAQQTGVVVISPTRSGIVGSDDHDTRDRQPEGRRRQDHDGGLAGGCPRRARAPGPAGRPRPPGLPDVLPRHRPRGPRAVGAPRADQGAGPARDPDRDRGRRRPAARHDRAGPGRVRPADPHRSGARDQVRAGVARGGPRRRGLRLGAAGLPAVAGRADRGRADGGDGVLVPLQCETLSHRGVGQLLDTVHDVRRFTNRKLEVWGVLPTLFDGRTNHSRTVLETISRDLRPRGRRAPDPEDDQVRRGARRRPFDPGHHGPLQQGGAGLSGGRGEPRRTRPAAEGAGGASRPGVPPVPRPGRPRRRPPTRGADTDDPIRPAGPAQVRATRRADRVGRGHRARRARRSRAAARGVDARVGGGLAGGAHPRVGRAARADPAVRGRRPGERVDERRRRRDAAGALR